MITVAGAPQPPRRRLRKAKPKEAEPEAGPATVPLTTLTAIRPEPLGDAEAAKDWLERLRNDEEGLETELDGALRFVNLAIHAQRTAALDPFLPDVAPERALAVRVGFGDGEGLADGRWEEAIEFPREPRQGRAEALAPQERIAAILGRHERIDAATGPLLHARADLDAGRTRDAALQVRVGLEALLADRATFGSAGQEGDLAALAERRAGTGDGANAALRGDLTTELETELAETLRLCERVLRRRKAFG